MRANEFVKKFGWDAAKYKADELKIFKGLGGELSIEDAHLMRIVESYELVEMWGGYNLLKDALTDDSDIRLKQAIADVESCQ